MSSPVLEVRGAAKRYGEVVALDGVDLTVLAGEIHGLIGPNGSGKSTLLKAIAGEHSLTRGSVILAGRDVTRLAPQHRVRQGLALKFQVTSIVPELTAMDNAVLALQARTGLWRLIRSTNVNLMRQEAASLLETFHLPASVDTPAGYLAHGQKQWLEIAMALALEPRLLLLDEPTAGMSPEERKSTGELLAELGRSRGMAMVIVEHDLDFVRGLCSIITVLHQGKVLDEGSPAALSHSEKVKVAYVSRSA